MKPTILSLAIISILASSSVMAATGDPVAHIFQSGTKAVAAEVNTNFQELADRVATVAAESGVPASSYDFRDFLPKGDQVRVYERLLPTTSESDAMNLYRTSERVGNGITEQVIVRERYDNSNAEWVKVFEIDSVTGLGLIEKRYFSHYDYSESLSASTTWSDPVMVLPATMSRGEVWAKEGACETLSMEGASPCYTLAKRTVLGLEVVNTPAGTFEGCLKVMEESSRDIVLYWYAPSMGLVKKVGRQDAYNSTSNDIYSKTFGWVLSSYSTESEANVVTASSILLMPMLSNHSDVAKVEYYRTGDTTPLVTREASTGVLHHELNLTASDNGTHSYTVKIYNSLDELVETVEKQLEVAIETDTTPPVITLAAAPTTVTTTEDVVFTVSSTDQLARVELLKGAEVVAIDIAPPYTMELEFDPLDNGTHQYSARAVDFAGNQAESSLAAITVNTLSPNAGNSATVKARSLVNEIRAAGVEALSDPAQTFTDELSLWDQTADAMMDQQMDGLLEGVGLLMDLYLDKTNPALIGGSGSYTYDLSSSGGTGSGVISESSNGGRVTYTMSGTANGGGDQVDMTVTVPEQDSFVGPLLALDVNGWVGESVNRNRLSVTGGRILIGLKQRLAFSESGTSYISFKVADLYVDTLEMELDVDLMLEDASSGDSLSYLGGFQLAGEMDLVGELSSSSYWSGNQEIFYSYNYLNNDLKMKYVALHGTAEAQLNGVNKELSFSVAARFDPDWDYPPRVGSVSQVGSYQLSADKMSLTITFVNEETLSFTYIPPSGNSARTIMLGGTLWSGYPSQLMVNSSWDGSEYSSVVRALQNLMHSNELGNQDDQMINLLGKGHYQFTLDQNWTYNLSENGGNIYGSLVQPFTGYGEPEERFTLVNLSFGAKIGLLPVGRVGLSLQRDISNHQLNASAVIAYGQTATEVTARIADEDQPNERLVDLVVRSQDGVEIRLIEDQNEEVSGTVSVNGAEVGTVSESTLGVHFTYSDGTSEVLN